MINIKDKLNRTNILLHRDKIINSDNISTEQFNDDIEQINGQINDLNDVADSLKQDIFENETKFINSDLRLIEEKIENRPAVTTKIDAFGYNFSKSTFTTFPAGFDFSKRVHTQYLFSGCSKLTGFTEPIYLDRCLLADHMFMYCESLTGVTLENTSRLIDTQFMFYNCSKLTTIPQLDTSKVTNMYNMVGMCKKLKSIPLLDCSSVKPNSDFMIFGFSVMSSLTDLGGFKDLKSNCPMYQCYDLTHQSLMNVINNVYDFRANGDTNTTKTLHLTENSYNLLSESDKLVATNKGWVITY